MAKNKISRGEFLSYSALGAASLIGVPSVLTACGSGGTKAAAGGSTEFVPLESEIPVYIPDLSSGKAAPGKVIKAGLIGCGGRGSGAANDFLNCGDDVVITAIADIFPDKIEGMRKNIGEEREKNNLKPCKVADDQCYIGFDSYQKLIDNADIDMVIITTPTVFHALMTKYAVEKGKHVFVEKPAAVDAVGTRDMLQACKIAKANNLSIVTGTQRHHEPRYLEAYQRVRGGWIGEIVSGYAFWNQAGPWFAKRKPGWTDMEYMLRDFFSWNWLCGDCVLDQAVHNVDVFTWFSHLKPVEVLGMGGRARRTTGDIYDYFSCDLTYEGGVHCHVMQRQIDDCDGGVYEEIHGTKGVWSSKDDTIRNLKGEVIWKYEYNDEMKAKYPQTNGYVNEHANLVSSIRNNKPICLAECTVYASAACNMARESAYTGKRYFYDQFEASDLDLMIRPLELRNLPEGLPQPKLPGKANNAAY